MQASNPGGFLAPDQVIGRDEIIATLWDVLESRNIYMIAERRMGKTSIIRDKMSKELPSGVRFIFMDVSKAGSPLEFVEHILNKSAELLDFGKKAKFFFATVGSRFLSGSEFKAGVSIKLPPELGSDWKNLLESLLRDLSFCPESVVLAFDELPLMLDMIRRKGEGGKGEALVMEMLDTLRAARQTNLTLRMIYTGSLGLHHVLTPLRALGYQNDPTNDMQLIEIEPLLPADATELARRLLTVEKITTDSIGESAQHLGTVTEGMPYYIHHLVSELKEKGLKADPSTIDAVLASRLTDMVDPWHLLYYDERIDTHYTASDCALARLLLDQIAKSSIALTFDDLVDGINPEKAQQNPEKVRSVLRLLGKDHYIFRDQDKSYRFRYTFIQKVWQAIRQ